MTGSEGALAGGGRGGSSEFSQQDRAEKCRVINYLQLPSLPRSARGTELSGRDEKGQEGGERDEKTEGTKRRSGGYGWDHALLQERMPGAGEHSVC